MEESCFQAYRFKIISKHSSRNSFHIIDVHKNKKKELHLFVIHKKVGKMNELNGKGEK